MNQAEREKLKQATERALKAKRDYQHYKITREDARNALDEFESQIEPDDVLSLVEEIERLEQDNERLQAIQSAYENGDDETLAELEDEEFQR